MQLIAIFHEEAEETFWETQRFGRIASLSRQADKLGFRAVTGELGSSRTAVPQRPEHSTAAQHDRSDGFIFVLWLWPIEDGEVAEIPKPPLCLARPPGNSTKELPASNPSAPELEGRGCSRLRLRRPDEHPVEEDRERLEGKGGQLASISLR